LQLQKVGISTAADALPQRMLGRIVELCAERDRLNAELPNDPRVKLAGGRRA
jgi:hypothetical protein